MENKIILPKDDITYVIKQLSSIEENLIIDKREE